MPMESLGGNLPAGRPAAVFYRGRTHVFAIGAGAVMNHWTSANGIDWSGPRALPQGGANVLPFYPCAVAAPDGIHVFAVSHGGLFSRGGRLVCWYSADGNVFAPPVIDSDPSPIPGNGNGITAAVVAGGLVDSFTLTTDGIKRYSRIGGSSARPAPMILPGAVDFSWCVPAAVSSRPNTVDVFVVSRNGDAVRWLCPDAVTGFSWSTGVLPRPHPAPAGPFVRTGFAAVSPGIDRVELFAVTSGGRMVNWSLEAHAVKEVRYLPGAPPLALNESIPAVVMVDGHIELFAIGQPPNPFTGGPLVRWRRGSGGWSDAKVISASLAAGGLAAAAAGNRIDAFGLAGPGLQHWPAGIAAASNEPWANWANNRRTNVTGHCHPSTEEEVLAIVRTAERVPGARVRAVGSSWSFSDVAMTPGFMVETNQLDGLITHVIDPSVLTEHAPDAKYLLHVEAGIQVEKLMLHLDFLQLAPLTLGGSSGQTLAGVISTSVHGSDWDRGPIPNAVRAIQLVGPGGVRHWIEPDQWRITNEAALRARLGPDVQIRYDDDWFDAVLVSMGSMGVITSVVLEATDQYFLEKSCRELKWSQLKPQLASGSLFADPDHYVMVAIDPAETGDRTCYLTTRRRSAGPRSGVAGSFDALAAYCRLNLVDVLHYLATASLAAPVAEALLSALTASAAAVGFPVPPPGATLAVAIPVFVAALKVAGAGAVGDFIGTLFNHSSEAAAALASYLTRDALKPGPAGTATDLAHRIMAPANPGECAARGLALEVAFDTSTGRHLQFVEEAMAALDQRRGQGMVLGGWFSLRFVGPCRAILSPQQSARTCMIEFVGLRSMNSTAPLLDELEKLATRLGAIQHWGMFDLPNLGAGSLASAYPRLDTWRRVRREISGNGAIRTFENAFSSRLGLDAPPAGTPLLRQQDWRWCRKCLGMAFAGNGAGSCPAGGTHDHSASGDYGFFHNTPSAPGQRNWRWCRKCAGMTLGGASAPCPAGGSHDLTASGEYTVLRNGQAGWRWCRKCQGLAFGGNPAPGACPAGGSHDQVGSGDYWLAAAPPVGSAEVPGERGWLWCNRCQGLTRPGGRCAGGVPHAHGGSGAYVVPRDAPTAPGQAHWRLCRKCQTLAFGQGACFSGGPHDLVGSSDYTLRGAGQAGWRHCRNCQGLWFSGNGGQGRCPSPAGAHDAGSDDYVA
jgi:hypothetical protein